ncbi:MAG TPA: hypothetical protein DCR14_13275 [Acidimicrobiaceae bacterium]|nr:hypothetical protein [Acidimicrobiaceae bacterium]
MRVPALPAAPAALLAEHSAAHDTLAAALGAAPSGVRDVFTALQRRQLVEALAYVQPVQLADGDIRRFPPARAHLTHEQELRIAGASAAFRHLDARAAMRRLGRLSSVLAPSTPCVLHALLEGLNPSGRETNAGMYRVTPTGWNAAVNPFRHPSAEQVEAMVGDAVAMAADAPAPGVVRGAWLTFTMLCIHPFVDGNGRVARALSLAVGADDLAAGIDWGSLEQWSVARAAYINALQEGQRCGVYDPDALDAAPFIRYAVSASTTGAARCTERVHLLNERWLAAEVDDASERAVLVAVECSGGATARELEALGLPVAELRQVLNQLLRRGRLQWMERPAGRRSATCPDRRHLTVTAGTPTARR